MLENHKISSVIIKSLLNNFLSKRSRRFQRISQHKSICVKCVSLLQNKATFTTFTTVPSGVKSGNSLLNPNPVSEPLEPRGAKFLEPLLKRKQFQSFQYHFWSSLMLFITPNVFVCVCVNVYFRESGSTCSTSIIAQVSCPHSSFSSIRTTSFQIVSTWASQIVRVVAAKFTSVSHTHTWGIQNLMNLFFFFLSKQLSLGVTLVVYLFGVSICKTKIRVNRVSLCSVQRSFILASGQKPPHKLPRYSSLLRGYRRKHLAPEKPHHNQTLLS